MEVMLVAPDAIKIKGKHASILVAFSQAPAKSDSEVLLYTTETNNVRNAIKNVALVINGAGEYEVNGIKITGIKIREFLGYILLFDGLRIFSGIASSLTNDKELLQECDVVCIYTDTVVKESLVASMNARIVVLYGENSQVSAKAIDQNTAPVAKVTFTRDKLPSEAQIVVLA